MTSEEPIITDNVSDFNDDEQQRNFHEHSEPSNQSESSSYFETISSQLSKNQEYSHPYQRKGSASTNDLKENDAILSHKGIG